MDWLWVLGGAILIIVAVVDALWTTLWPDGRGGPIASALSRAVAGSLDRVAGGRRRLLSLAGPLVLVLSVTLWVTMLAAGWTLVFTPEEALRSTRQEPEDLTSRIWYVVYTMHTVGNGDLTPTTGWSEIASSLTAFTGMAMITLAVTYLLSVVQAVAQRRTFASSVSSLGDRAEEIVINAWDGDGFPALDSVLNSISSAIGQAEHQRRAFPTTRYFHPEDPTRSSEMMLAVFDDALTLWLAGVAESKRPAPAVLQAARRSVQDLLDVLDQGGVKPSDQPPAAPKLAEIRKAGIPTVSDAAFAAEIERLSDRRRLLLGAVRSDGWQWDSTDS